MVIVVIFVVQLRHSLRNLQTLSERLFGVRPIVGACPIREEFAGVTGVIVAIDVGRDDEL
ncbi:hypothetical protein [Paenibacillus sp. JNUCC31]|uniref:hypothetical protein n=1 Tax=Paenibacillus sp. JNUCC-31 TaxID=2777983 RepID=UPI001E2CC6CF|nr:hypothetical protein [Paenibacillus sp. JNUCC-31]